MHQAFSRILQVIAIKVSRKDPKKMKIKKKVVTIQKSIDNLPKYSVYEDVAPGFVECDFSELPSKADATYCCNICPYSTNLEHRMERHIHVHARRTLYECHYCKKPFRKRNALNMHLFVHTGEKPFACDMCPLTFRQVGHLKRHKLCKHYPNP